MQECDIKRFTPEAKAAVETKLGRIVYPTAKSEIAVNPQGFYSPDTNNKTMEEHREMNEDDTQRLRAEAGTDGFLKRLGEYDEVVGAYNAHLHATGQRLIQKYDLSHVRTKTPVTNDPTRTICVGDPTDSAGITSVEAKKEDRYLTIYLADLIFPA
ncbi:MAG: hypothetical protein Q7K55_07045 [Candidatus Levybacteria bacterium]|nr:hypothetical protein [Candidatus Levybacteria bacterium]